MRGLPPDLRQGEFWAFSEQRRRGPAPRWNDAALRRTRSGQHLAGCGLGLIGQRATCHRVFVDIGAIVLLLSVVEFGFAPTSRSAYGAEALQADRVPYSIRQLPVFEPRLAG
jgi:hypothetical protein